MVGPPFSLPPWSRGAKARSRTGGGQAELGRLSCVSRADARQVNHRAGGGQAEWSGPSAYLRGAGAREDSVVLEAVKQSSWVLELLQRG
eukprot:936570-Heterocapsa_arctica.AAC.1